MPPSIEELEERQRRRGTDSAEQIRRRLDRVRVELGALDEPGVYDYPVVNRVVERAAAEFCAIITAERCRNARGR